MEFFKELVDSFYDGVRTDEVLLPLYPEQPDLTGARHRLTLFLAQYWGGPVTYMEQRGHPRLRMRHASFRVGALERDRWLINMAAAVENICEKRGIDPDINEELMTYFVSTAEHLRNDAGTQGPSPVNSPQR